MVFTLCTIPGAHDLQVPPLRTAAGANVNQIFTKRNIIMGIASFIIGILTALGACFNLIPGMSWANCILGPIATVSAILGLISLFSQKENKIFGGIGLTLNAVALIIAIIRIVISFLAGGFGIL
jgi:hypothetical protein